VVLVGFDGSAITYRARFWIEDYERDEAARDEVRTAIYYAFGRHGIEIPWPIQVEYERTWPPGDPNAPLREREQMLGRLELFASLDEEQRRDVASSTGTRVFGTGEAIVRQGAAGQSMFVVCSGQARVIVGDDNRHVATIGPGGYFGEMSLLTGEPRTATVLAEGETVVLEIDAQVFRDLGTSNPQTVERIAVAAVTRRAELENVRSAARGMAVAEMPATLLTRMRKFLGLS
jgi:CRP-like cAMP-binding protein